MGMKFRSDILPEGVRISASTGWLRKTPVSFMDWQNENEESAAIVQRVCNSLIAQGAASIAPDGSIIMSHDAAVALPASVAERMNLPVLAQASATLSFQERVESPSGNIRVRWYDLNSRSIQASRIGAFLKIGDRFGLLAEPVYRLMEAIDGYNSTQGQSADSRIESWGPVQEALRDAIGESISADDYLGSLTIYQAGAFALDVRETAHGPDFVPILMSRDKAVSLEDFAPAAESGEAEPSGELRDADEDALLPPELQEKFIRERYETDGRTRSGYVLGRNTFVVLTQELKQALDVVRQYRSAPPEARRAFVRNPRPAIAEVLGEDGELLAASLFVETHQYSDRVIGLGIWERPTLPWLQTRTQQWLPERFSIRLGGHELLLSQEEAEDLHHEVKQAELLKEPKVTFQGNAYPTEEVKLALEELRPAEEVEAAKQAGSDIDAEEDRQVLLIKPNLEDTDYRHDLATRYASIPDDLPQHLMGSSRPKAHQVEGFRWLVHAWKCGVPGALLADDMGLGKTFQALSFLAWLQENRSKGAGRLTPRQKGPILVVAPTALLNNWIAEAESHLAPYALGERVDAFGPGLRLLKGRRTPSWTPEDALDVERLRRADWILTTYETLANHHRAFGRVAYSAAVFDEMQKVKDPRTINTHAVKAMNVEFVLGLTGTPIENRLEDLWCIIDRIAPGRLGNLKDFSRTYGGEDPRQLENLKAKLDQPQENWPPIMLRRMKEDHIEGLPQKSIQRYPSEMPAPQAEAYMKAVRTAKAGTKSPKTMLEAIHALRGISLHPYGNDEVDPYDFKTATAWISQSARLNRAVEILWDIEAKEEKALIFIEDRAVQSTMAKVIATLFGLREEPSIINGAVPGHRRQEIVRRFQASPAGFGLLILSPKAAGVGLTITAANHVIHLSRWWNPAVEDQCNDRCYRIGQDKPVFVHIPMAIQPTLGDASFDVTLDRLLQRKRELSRNMLAPPVSDRDVDELFTATIGGTGV